MSNLKVRDIKTRETFELDPTDERVTVKTADGFKVKVYPTSIRMMVPVNGRFNGVTVTGKREMERIK